MSDINIPKVISKQIRIKNVHARECLSEFLGTLMLIVFGNAAVAQGVLTNNTVNPYFNIVMGWAVGVTFGVAVSAGISGGHINPAVTVALALWGKFPWKKVPGYLLSQYLGSFAASAVCYFVYIDALHAFESQPSISTASIFATYPGSVTTSDGMSIPHLTLSNGIFDQIWGTMVLLIGVCAIGDQKNAKIASYLSPLMVGALVMGIGMSFGFNCGFAINPARDFAPRLFTYFAGWGDIPFGATTVDGYVWWWVPIVGPHIGAILGVFAYTMLIDLHNTTEEPDPKIERSLEKTKAQEANMQATRIHNP